MLLRIVARSRQQNCNFAIFFRYSYENVASDLCYCLYLLWKRIFKFVKTIKRKIG